MPETKSRVFIHDGTQQPFGTLECTRCGTLSGPVLGAIAVDDLVSRIHAFEAGHVDCPNYLTGNDPGDECRPGTAAPDGFAFRLTFTPVEP